MALVFPSFAESYFSPDAGAEALKLIEALEKRVEALEAEAAAIKKNPVEALQLRRHFAPNANVRYVEVPISPEAVLRYDTRDGL